MLLQQLKTWTANRSLQSRSRVCHGSSRGSATLTERVESDGNYVTWPDATGSVAAKVAQELAHGCSITASRIKEGSNDSTRPSKSSGPDPHTSTICAKSKIQLIRTQSNVSTLMHSFSYHSPGHIAAASCLPREDMWRPCEQAEQVEIPAESLVETIHHTSYNPHDMLGTVSSTSYAAQSLDDSAFAEERDKETLRIYFQESTNLVLHSDCPHLAPHIVITPADESPNDFYTPWNNRTLPQWTGFLMVPPYDLATGRLCPPSYLQPPEFDSQCSEDDTLVDENIQAKDIAAISAEHPKRVYSRSRFTSFVEATANERLILYHVVKALQKHQCKVAAYAASVRAAGFCQRYASPDFLASIEKPFVWTDPAEPLLSSIKLMPGATILESPCPFITPHILISGTPTQNPWIPWHNAINDPQDGRYLVISSPRVNYINMNEYKEEPERWTTPSTTSSRFFLADDSDDEEEVDNLTEDADYEDEDDSEVDHSESLPPSRPSSPGPETPTDDTTFLRGFFSVRRPNFVIDEDDEDDRALALAIAKNAVEEYYKNGTSLLRVSLPVIEEEDSFDGEGFSPVHSSVQMQLMVTDEDDHLPSEDDWYHGASSRLTPGVQVAVG